MVTLEKKALEGQPDAGHVSIIDLFIQNPVIAAIRDDQALDEVIRHRAPVVFMLASDICTLENACQRLRKAGKHIFLHIDLVEGLRADHAGIEYVVEHMKPTGIISTKSTPIRLAHAAGLYTIQRTFMLDSSALKTSVQNVASGQPDLVELLPGICPEIISMAIERLKTPVIAGGFIKSKRDVMSALRAGAIAVSTSENTLWSLDE